MHVPHVQGITFSRRPLIGFHFQHRMPPLNGVNGNELSGEFEHVSILRPILHLAIVEAREGATELFSSSKRQESMLTPGTCRNDLIYRSKPAKFISYAHFCQPSQISVSCSGSRSDTRQEARVARGSMSLMSLNCLTRVFLCSPWPSEAFWLFSWSLNFGH